MANSQVLVSVGTGVSSILPNSDENVELGFGHLFKAYFGARLYHKYDLGLEHMQTSIYDDQNNKLSTLILKGIIYISPLGKYEAHLKPKYLYYLAAGAGLYTYTNTREWRYGDRREDLLGFNIAGGIRQKDYTISLDYHASMKSFILQGYNYFGLSISYNFELFREQYSRITTKYDCE